MSAFRGRFVAKTRKICRFECRKCAKQRQLHAFRDRIQSRVPAAPTWAAWRVSLQCGWAARRTAVLRISSCYRQSPERSSLGAGFGRSVRSRSTWLAAWAWWAGSCVMRRVRVQPGCVRTRPCSIARFGVSCRGRRDRISVLRWIVDSCRLPVAGCRLPVASCQWPLASCQVPVASGQWPVARCQLPVASGEEPVGTVGAGRTGARLATSWGRAGTVASSTDRRHTSWGRARRVA